MKPVGWSLVQQLGRVGFGAVFYLGISRVVGPSEVGRVAAAGAVLNLLGVFSDMGFGAALVQRADIDVRHVDTVFALNVAAAVVLCAAGVAASWPASMFMRVPSAQPILAALSLNFLLTGVSAALAAVAVREMRFRMLALRDMPAVLVGGVAGLVVALRGGGAWALVAQTLVTESTAAALLWRASARRPRLRGYTPAVVPELWRFSSRLLASNVFKYFVQNLDAVVIGRLFGPAALGRYVLVYRVVLRPVAAATAGVGSALFPAAARAQHDPAAVARQYARAWAGLNYCCLLPAVVLGVWGGAAATAALGPAWHGLDYVFATVCVMTVAHPPIAPLGQVMKGLGRPGWLLWWSAFFALLSLVGIVAGAWGGFRTALAGLAAANVVSVGGSLVALSRLLPGRVASVLRAVLPSYAAVAAFAAALLLPRVTGLSGLAAAAVGLVAALVAVRLDPWIAGLLRRRFWRAAPAL